MNQDPENYGYLVDGDGKWREIDTMKFWWNRGGDASRAIKGKALYHIGKGMGDGMVKMLKR